MGRRACFGFQVRAQCIPGSRAEQERGFFAKIGPARELAHNLQVALAGRGLKVRIRHTRTGQDVPIAEVK